MKFKRSRMLVLLFAVLTLVCFITPTRSAYAASDYDNLIHTSPSLYVYTDGAAKSQKMDISQSWLDELGQTYTKRLAQGTGWPSNLMSTLYDIKSSGSLGMLMRDDSNSNTVEIYGTTDPDAYCGFTGDAITGSFGCMVHAGYKYVSVTMFTHNSWGGAGCGWWWAATCSDNGMNVYTTPTVETAITSPTQFLYVSNVDMSNVEFYYLGFNTTYPTGYDGEIIPTQPPNATYVAMGDSFSSGEGNPPFEGGTNTGSDDCHRSSQAWPRKLEFDSSLNLSSTYLAACSGSTSDYIINSYNTQNIEPTQVTWLSGDTKLVTITIGGNDIGFPDVMKTCTLADTVDSSVSTEERHWLEHDNCISALQSADDIAKSTAFQDKLEAVFAGIRSAGASNLQLVVVGYPNLFPSYGDITSTCVWGDGMPNTSGRTIASDETQSARLVHDDLNTTIQAAVSATGDSNIHFVDPTTAFAGHELCRADPWFNNVVGDFNDPALISESYHPNASGQAAYTAVVKSEVQALFP